MSETPIRPTERTTVHRVKERGSFDRDVIYPILDEGLVCHVGFVDPRGFPVVIPMAYARRGDTLLLHGSVASRLMTTLAGGAEVCVTVTHLDGVVVSRSGFHSSMNYRSVVIFGRAEPLEGKPKSRALDALVEHLIPGRSADLRPSTAKEMAATLVLALPIEEASAKVRTGPPKDPKDDLGLPMWAGVIPLSLEPGAPEPDPHLPPGTPVPEYLQPYRRGG